MFSVNELASKICQKMIDEAEELGIKYFRFENGAHMIDTGNRVPGGVQCGLYVTQICLGGVGNVSLASMQLDDLTLPAVAVATDFPVFSLLCQASGGYREAMEGWINFEVGQYKAIASGPARAVVHEPKELFEMIGYKDSAHTAVVVLQSEQYPDEKVVDYLMKRCGVAAENLYVVLSPLSSMSGLVQVTGRSVENAMVKLRTLGFNVRNVEHAFGIAPLPPLNSRDIIPDDMLSYGSIVHLHILPEEGKDLKQMSRRIPSCTSRDYGKSFTELIEKHGGLRGIDIDLFAPAEVYVNNLENGETYRAGKINAPLLKDMAKLH